MNKSILTNEKINKVFQYILPSVVTAILFCIVLIIKNIYPFGKESIDYYDLSAQIVTYYIHIWDSLHGAKNIFYDVYSALSTNMVTTCGSSSFSVFNLFFLFIRRENILKCMSLFLLLKMIVMSFSMNVFLKKTVKISTLVGCIFSVLYSFSGFVLMNYTIMEWMDIAAFFPLIMYGLYRLLSEGDSIVYTVTLTLSVIAGYYISFMVIIYVFLIVGLIIFVDFVNHESDGNDYHLVTLLVSTVASIAMSAFILLPQIMQTMASARFTNESGGGLLGMYVGILKNVKPAYTSRWFVIVGISLPIAIIVYGMIKLRNNKKLLMLTVGAVFIMCSELLFENVSLFWHYGSYVHYPVRNGFMITFTFSVLACIYLNQLDETNHLVGKADTLISRALEIIVPTVMGIILIGTMIFYKNHSGLPLRQVFHIVAAVIAIMVVAYFVLVAINSKYRIRSVSIILVFEIVFYCFLFVGQPTYITGYAEEPEMERDSVYVCNDLYEKLEFSDDLQNVVNRIKNPDTSLNANYPLVLRRSALSNWTALIDPSLQDNAARLGYSIQYTRLLDAGGTVFSDALLGVKNIVSRVKQDEKIYDLTKTVEATIDQKTGEQATYFYYDTKYALPFGLLANEDAINVYGIGETAAFYNGIYHSIEGSDAESDIAERIVDIDLGKTKDFSEKEENINISVEGNKALYYFGNQVDTDDYNTRLTVKGETITVPTINELDNFLYPAHFNNNALYLGSYEDENVDISIHVSSTDRNENQLDKQLSGYVLSIDLDILDDLCTYYKDKSWNTEVKKDGYFFKIDNTNDSRYLLIPISRDKGYTAKVNNKKVNCEFFGGLFTAIPLSDGINEITATYLPDGMIKGIIVSLISVIVYLAYVYASKKEKVCNIIRKMKWMKRAYIVGWAIVIWGIYIIPIGYGVLSYLL